VLELLNVIVGNGMQGTLLSTATTIANLRRKTIGGFALATPQTP
jgi:hypothetical protein